jgi:hypothetical protein
VHDNVDARRGPEPGVHAGAPPVAAGPAADTAGLAAEGEGKGKEEEEGEGEGEGEVR